MFRLLAFLTKRDGLSTEDFIDHYENRHVPLILSLAPAPRVYTRRYRGEMLTHYGGSVDFDVVTELGFADRAAYVSWSSRPPTARSAQTRRDSLTGLGPAPLSSKTARPAEGGPEMAPPREY